MSKDELIAELEKLTPKERWEVLAPFCSPEPQSVGDGAEPTEEEKAILDEAEEEEKRNPDAGEPWEVVQERLLRRL